MQHLATSSGFLSLLAFATPESLTYLKCVLISIVVTSDANDNANSENSQLISDIDEISNQFELIINIITNQGDYIENVTNDNNTVWVTNVDIIEFIK